jgi:hypothetical protein
MERIEEQLEHAGYPLLELDDPGRTLIAIITQREPRLVYSIPYLLTTMAHDALTFRSRIKRTLAALQGKQRAMLIELLVITSELYGTLPDHDSAAMRELRTLVTVIAPKNLNKKIRAAHGSNHTLPNGITINLASAQTTLLNYTARSTLKAAGRPLRDEFRTQYALSQLFTQRQKQIIIKRHDGRELTKTEKEYYSRAIKKRINALLDPDVRTFLERTR